MPRVVRAFGKLGYLDQGAYAAISLRRYNLALDSRFCWSAVLILETTQFWRRGSNVQDNSISNEDFIARVAADLRESLDTDHDLVEILTQHILKVEVSNTAVEDAVDAITTLASNRGSLKLL